MKALVRAERVGAFLEQVLRRKVSAKMTPAWSISGPDPTLTAVYENEEGEAVAVCVCDLSLVLNAGAALALIPVYEAQKNSKAKIWEESLVENFKEVLNIFAHLFCELQSARIKLGDISYGAKARSAQAIKLVAKPGLRADIEASIAGYEAGRLTIIE